MIADMHCHYPMHVLAQDPPERWAAAGPIGPNATFEAMTNVSRRPGWLNKLRARLLRRAADELSHEEEGKWRVSLEGLEKGDVRAVFSVLYEPFAEIDLDELPGSDPEQGYFGDLVNQLERVEGELKQIDPGGKRHKVVRNLADLDESIGPEGNPIEDGRVAFMHCVEGGFHLGGDLDRIDERVAELARRGVVYITVSHLFWRGVAGNAPALPFLSDEAYNRIFFLWRKRGLSELGRRVIRAMYEHDVLIDVSHMNQPALDQTFELLGKLDEEHGREPREYPVIASHAGYRFNDRQAYLLSPDTIGKIAARDGVIGLILAQHQLNEGAGVVDPDNPFETVQTLFRHIDAIRESTPDRDNLHVAIGSDLDGFIKPTVAGVGTAADLSRLRGPLARAYGEEDAVAILSGNALRVVRRILARRPVTASGAA